MSDTPHFDLVRLSAERARLGVRLGAPAAWTASTESTNDDALAAAKRGAPHGSLFGAETQLRGRGRRGNAWVSPAGEGLWFSLLLRPRLRPEQAPALALVAGLSLRAPVARRLAAPVRVKWPNDVLAGGLKIAGVLVESQVTGGELGAVVMGIGLNVTQRELPEALRGTATSLALLGGSDCAREPLLAEILSELEARLEALAARGAPAISEELRKHDALYGHRVRVDDLSGTAAGIEADGRLLLRRDDDTLETVTSGHVQLLD